MKEYCFGIDVGGTSIKCGLFTSDGTLLEKWEIPTRTENEGENIVPDIAETILSKMKEKALSNFSVIGIGLDVPGPVNEKGEVSQAVNLHWGYKHLSKELQELTDLPVRVGNDANVAALGEMWKGGGAGYRNVILVTLGTGVGGGIIVDGHIVSGSHGAGGEIGHAIINPAETDTCNCGGHGCLEQYASATGIVRLAKRELAASPEPSLLRTPENGDTSGISGAEAPGTAKNVSGAEASVTAKDVFDAMKKGDALATRVVDKFADYLGMGLAQFACVVDPDVIVIGGGVSRAGDILTEKVQKEFRKYAFPACKPTPLVLAQLGNDAGIYGAAKMVFG